MTGKRKEEANIVFLHHSTGKSIWMGNTGRYMHKLTGKSDVAAYFKRYNKTNSTRYRIEERYFPKKQPYGWKNYPFDYYNIWVKNGGDEPYMEEPTLEILTRKYNVIIFKHCYPVSRIKPDTGTPDIDSEIRTVENYKLQYNALKDKMHEFPDNKFVVWSPAVLKSSQLSGDEARRTAEFYRWMLNEWNEKDDNIHIWDFYNYETEGGLYLLDAYASGPVNSHPGRSFAARVAPLFCKFIIDLINESDL